jgi:hypothetical protein
MLRRRVIEGDRLLGGLLSFTDANAFFQDKHAGQADC